MFTNKKIKDDSQNIMQCTAQWDKPGSIIVSPAKNTNLVSQRLNLTEYY